MKQISSLTVAFKTLFFTQILGTAINKMYRLYNLFKLVSLTVSTCRKEARNKRKQFPLDTKSLSTSGNKVSPKNQVIYFSGGFQQQKKDSTREKDFHKTETPYPPYGIKNLFKNTFPLGKKQLSLAGVSEKKKKNLPRKSVSTSRNKFYLKKKVATLEF